MLSDTKNITIGLAITADEIDEVIATVVDTPKTPSSRPPGLKSNSEVSNILKL